MSQKIRLDHYLVTHSLAPTREQARRLIMAKQVLVNNEPIIKPGTMIKAAAAVTVLSRPQFVSRAGEKLAKALAYWNLHVDNYVCLDIGASTGGFTDCLLQHQAKLVYAIDVGTNQLAWKLRQDPRVISHEQLNFRHVSADLFKSKLDLVVVDVSFISLTIILEHLSAIIDYPLAVIALIKPQFEAQPEQVQPGGIINDPNLHQQIVSSLLTRLNQADYQVLGLTFSPIQGHKKANIEFLAYLQLHPTTKIKPLAPTTITSMVQSAWDHFYPRLNK